MCYYFVKVGRRDERVHVVIKAVVDLVIGTFPVILNASCDRAVNLILNLWVKVQYRGPKLYKKKGALFKEKSYLPWIFRSSSLNLHTFYLINMVFRWRIFPKHGKSTPNDRQDHHVLVADVVIMTSQCRCTRALSQSHVAKHDNHVPVTPLIGSGLAVMSMQWLPCDKIMSVKTLNLHSNWGHPCTIVSPTCSWRHTDTRYVQFFLK